MELCDMDLSQDLLNKHTRMEQLDMIRQIVTGMKHLFNQRMIHRDLKPQNILLKKYKRENEELKIYKISDFGFCKTLIEPYAKQDISLVGTQRYCSPQITRHQQYSAKCDIYSLGILFYQIFFSALPSFAEQNQILKDKPLKCPNLEGEYAEEIKELLERMIVYEEDNRINFEDLFNHKIFRISLPINDPLLVKIEGNYKERINKVLQVFYHKFQICNSAVEQFQQEIHLSTIDSDFCNFLMLSIGLLQIRYAFGLIYGIISDLHPYFRNSEEQIRLLEMVAQVQQETEMFQIIRNTYWQQFVNFKHQCDFLYTKLSNNNQQKQQIEKLIWFLDKSSSQKITFETLRNQLYITLYKSSFSECFHRLDKY